MFIAVFEAYRINRNTFKGESFKVGEQEKALRRSLSKSVKLHTSHTSHLFCLISNHLKKEGDK